LSKHRRNTHDLLLLGRALRQLREQRRLSQSELAATASVEEGRIKALESGQLDPDYELLLALTEGLGTRPAALVLRAEALAKEDRASTDQAT
jgi:transcriptional regulator with XRE-family HTH domain